MKHDLFRPCRTMIFVRQTHEDAVVSYYCQIQHAVVIEFRQTHSAYGRKICGQDTLAELTLAFITEDVQFSDTVDQRGVGIAVGVEVAPGEVVDSLNGRENIHLFKGTVTVVSQNPGLELV